MLDFPSVIPSVEEQPSLPAKAVVDFVDCHSQGVQAAENERRRPMSKLCLICEIMDKYLGRYREVASGLPAAPGSSLGLWRHFRSVKKAGHMEHFNCQWLSLSL
jgi:hypothetical protein